MANQHAVSKTPATSGEGENPEETGARVAGLIVVFIAFVPLAFSEAFIDASFEAATGRVRDAGTHEFWWLLLVVDFALLTIILAAILLLRHRGLLSLSSSTIWIWGLFASVGTLALDLLVTFPPYQRGFWADLLSDAIYVALTAVLLAVAVGADPQRLFVRPSKQDWRQFRVLLPLLIGTLAAYTGGELWAYELDKDGDGSGEIEVEFFAQLSQVIPLLFVALALEANFFRNLMKDAVQRAVTIVTVIILCIGEVMTVSALTRSENSTVALNGWHEWSAFVLALEAVFVALAMLIWAAVLVPKEPDVTAVRIVDSREWAQMEREVDTSTQTNYGPTYPTSIAMLLTGVAAGWIIARSARRPSDRSASHRK